jgi:glycosyltransferase involved in cell wall biosynthesis
MSDGERYEFTVFTATFDRAHTLPRVYQALLAQTWRDFEWVVVDDGSTDATPELVGTWIEERRIPIRYLRQPNRGKHAATNRAVEHARGRLFLPLDSDDACVPRALERLAYHWSTIPEADRESFAGVACLCQDPSGQIVGDRFPREVVDCSLLEMTYRHRVRGEKWGFNRTDVLRRVPFSEEHGRTCLPESLVWHAIARTYRTRFVDEPLRIYYVDPGAPSLAHHQPAAKNALGGMLKQRMVLNDEIEWARVAPFQFLRAAALFARFALHRGLGLGAQARELRRPLGRALWLAALPLGVALFLRDRARA